MRSRSTSTLFRVARLAATAIATVWIVLWRLLCWVPRHWRWALPLVLLGATYWVGLPKGHELLPARFRLPSRVTVAEAAAAAILLPGIICVCWATYLPGSWERIVAGPGRRRRWRRWARNAWPHLTRECGLAVRRPGGDGQVWIAPILLRVNTKGDTLSLVIRTRLGQTVDDLEAAVPAIGSASRAVSSRCVPLDSATARLEFVMRDVLLQSIAAEAPAAVRTSSVAMGRRQNGRTWGLQLQGRHTLVVGCSGSGKGSVLWGICGGLAPAVHLDLVRLWAVDLKRGVEVSMGAGLFSHIATDPHAAIATLRRLLQVIDERGRQMAGLSRLHEPAPGDPLHVLVVDELAALTAYGDADTRRDGNRLLAEILTQGRALGVVVVACVQDPRKEVVGMRGLFTQTIALRLRSVDETRMVLGDGTASLAPAHRLSPNAPGSAWIVDDQGATDRVRADFWPDPLIREVARMYRAPHQVSQLVNSSVGPSLITAATEPAQSSEPPASSRKPRTPRTSTRSRADSVAAPAEPASDLGQAGSR